MESIKEDLLKSIYYYFDLKENCKYLIYFTTTTKQHQDLTCSCTNGINVWNINLTSDIFSSTDKKTTLNEHLINLNLKLKRNNYELNKLIDTQNLIDLIEFKTNDNNTNIQFKFKPVKSNENDLKEFLFHMFNRLDKCESELNKLKSNDFSVQSASNLMQNSEIKHNNNNSNNHQARRFNLSKNQVANIIAPRQPYMSIINPMTKRRKMPKGVQFDDDEDDDDEEEEAEEEEKANKTKHVK
jgi:hypothetical protein